VFVWPRLVIFCEVAEVLGDNTLARGDVTYMPTHPDRESRADQNPT